MPIYVMPYVGLVCSMCVREYLLFFSNVFEIYSDIESDGIRDDMERYGTIENVSTCREA